MTNQKNESDTGANVGVHDVVMNQRGEGKALLRWYAHIDDSGNTYWKARSPYISDGESVDIWWRLRQKISNDKIVWLADHDAELKDPSAEDEWVSLSVATNSVQRQHDDIVAEFTSGEAAS